VAASGESALRVASGVLRGIEIEGFATCGDNGPATGEVAVDAGYDVGS
jgi:hypothetical protein